MLTLCIQVFEKSGCPSINVSSTSSPLRLSNTARNSYRQRQYRPADRGNDLDRWVVTCLSIGKFGFDFLASPFAVVDVATDVIAKTLEGPHK